MGRQTEYACKWGHTAAPVTALLESTELILHGGLRHRIPLLAIDQVQVEGENLCFSLGEDPSRCASEAIRQLNGRKQS